MAMMRYLHPVWEQDEVYAKGPHIEKEELILNGLFKLYANKIAALHATMSDVEVL
jgi:hypothetical protein